MRCEAPKSGRRRIFRLAETEFVFLHSEFGVAVETKINAQILEILSNSDPWLSPAQRHQKESHFQCSTRTNVHMR